MHNYSKESYVPFNVPPLCLHSLREPLQPTGTSVWGQKERKIENHCFKVEVNQERKDRLSSKAEGEFSSYF